VGLLNPHLDDGALAQVWAERLSQGAADNGAAEGHLRACAECRGRFAAFSGWLDDLKTDAHAEADAVFHAERLSAQQAHIFRRLEALEHPARVIAFPRFARPAAVASTGRRRWIAAAAAAGLVAGIGLGQVLELGVRPRSEPAPASAQIVARGPGAPTAEPQAARLQPIAAPSSDEVFLYEQEPTPTVARVPASLQYLNAITPGARDYDSR
jgi:hypothetical protein